VTASDADGDVLTYAWTSNCLDGALRAWRARSQVLFCGRRGRYELRLVVTVSDGRGGSTTGQTTLPVGKPTAIEAPTITGSVQSLAEVEAGGNVNFSVDATDPQSGALTFRGCRPRV